MRPIRLIIQAFGAYVQDKLGKPIVIDFAKLGKKGLFLVTGDTGAGKTTIFDAITYALFGKTSGETRDGSMMRSTYAPDNVPTFVELEFEYDGKKYKVKRTPAQLRPKERGEGMTAVSETAVLEPEGAAPVTSLKEVNRMLTEIMGVTFDQYSQISMIAQGKFRDLLDADTKTRSEIFRSIFKTGNFLKLQLQLKEDANALYNEVCNERRSVAQYVNGAVCPETSEKAPVLEEAKLQVKNNRMTIADARQVIQDILDCDLNDLEENRKELETVEKELGKIAADLKDLETYNKNRIALDGKIQERNRQENEVKPGLEKAVADAESQKPVIESLTAEIERMKLVMDNYAKLTQCNKEITENSRKYTDAVRNRNSETVKKEELAKQMEKDDAELKSIKDPGSDIATIEARQKAIDADRKKISSLNTSFAGFNRDFLKLPGMQQDVQKKEKAWSDKNREYDEKHRLFIAEQAGYLAEELEEGMPCPVCGSTHHPTLAKKAEDAPTKAELEAMANEVERLKGEAEKAANDYSAKKASVNTAKDSLLENAETIVGTVTIEELPGKLQTKADALDREYETNASSLTVLNKLKKRKEELENKRPDDAEKLAAYTQNEAGFNAEAVRLQTEGNALQKQLPELKKDLAYDSEELAKKALTEKGLAKKKLENAVDSARKALADYDRNLAGIDSSIKLLIEQTETIPAVDADAASARQEELLAKKKELGNRKSILDANTKINERVISDIDRTSGRLTALEEEYRWKNSLAQTANGEIAGKDRISLETYVQMAFFDHILQRANTRLMIMSGGQYELRRSDISKGRAQAGLDLDVLDHYNGTTRSVKSLSGGESFKAALSLALGLSDEIQASCGGIRLDTMFVDEGFGSLDEESLDQALKALNALTEGDRLIGIISHVAELKKIDKQIVVTKDKMEYSQVEVRA